MLTQTEQKNVELLKDAEEATFYYQDNTAPHAAYDRRVKPVEIVEEVSEGLPFLLARDLDEEAMIASYHTADELEQLPDNIRHAYRKYSLIDIKNLSVK